MCCRERPSSRAVGRTLWAYESHIKIQFAKPFCLMRGICCLKQISQSSLYACCCLIVIEIMRQLSGTIRFICRRRGDAENHVRARRHCEWVSSAALRTFWRSRLPESLHPVGILRLEGRCERSQGWPSFQRSKYQLQYITFWNHSGPQCKV